MTLALLFLKLCIPSALFVSFVAFMQIRKGDLSELGIDSEFTRVIKNLGRSVTVPPVSSGVEHETEKSSKIISVPVHPVTSSTASNADSVSGFVLGRTTGSTAALSYMESFQQARHIFAATNLVEEYGVSGMPEAGLLKSIDMQSRRNTSRGERAERVPQYEALAEPLSKYPQWKN